MKLKSNKLINTIKYYRLIIETRLGDVEYSCAMDGLIDEDYSVQLEVGSGIINELTDNELDEIDDLIEEQRQILL